jgi:hypothetical protein
MGGTAGGVAALQAGGWSIAESGTDRGHVAEAAIGAQVVRVAAPSAALAWELVGKCVVAPRPVNGS